MKSIKESLQSKLISVLLLGILVILIVCPLVSIFQKAAVIDGRLDFSYALSVLQESKNLVTIVNSLMLATSVTLVATLIATPLAYILARTPLGKSKALDLITMIPFMTPPYISSMGWILFMQKNGLLQQMIPGLKGTENLLFSFVGLTIVMALHVFPFVTTILKNAMLNISTSLEEAGAVFKANFWVRMKHILLPLLTGNFAIAALLVFVKTLSEYGTPATLGTRMGFHVFTTDIHRYSTTSPIDFAKSASLSSILIFICMGMWLLQSWITAKKSYKTIGGKGIKIIRKPFSAYGKMIVWGYLFLILMLSIGIPYFSIFVTSLIKLRGFGLRLDNFTFNHYIQLFTNAKALKAIISSFQLAILSATIASVLGTLIVSVIRKKKGLSKQIEGVGLLPEMLPSIVLVIGAMLFYNSFAHIFTIYNTFLMMVIVYVMLYLPYSIQYVTSAYTQISDSLTQAGRVFGAKPWTIFKRITFPLILKGIAGGWIMIFIISFRELVAASMVAPPGTLTISTFIVREFEQGSVSTGMAMAVLCVVLTTGTLIVFKALTEKERA